jgi:hypothetical protein
MTRAVNLTAHKNTLANRQKRDRAKDAGTRVEAMIRENDIRSFAFVGLGSDGRAFTFWDTGGIVPLFGFPETMGAILRIDVDRGGAEENYRAPVTGGGFKREVSK